MASGSGRRAFDPNSLYDVSKDEMRRIQARRELRDNLKKEFEFKRSNPFKPMGEHLVCDLGLLVLSADNLHIRFAFEFQECFFYCIVFSVCGVIFSS